MLRSFSSVCLLFVLSLCVLILACASGASGPGVKYPPRRQGCGLRIFHADLPGVPAWEDIGKLEIICHIDDSEATCFNKVRVEACRMGGDVIYHLPAKPWRPSEYAIGYRAMVAHTRVPPVTKGAGDAPSNDELPPPATAEEAAGPVVPLTGPAAPRAEVDGGGDARTD